MSPIEEEIEWMDRMKEVQRIQYDYFKNLIALSTGSILIIVAILGKAFTDPQKLVKVLIMFSMIGFAIAIIFSLRALRTAGNIILYINGLQKAVIDHDEEKKIEFIGKIGEKLDVIKICDNGTFWSYISSIGIFLISMGFYFFY